MHGHLPVAIQAEVERATGLDSTTVVARISDIAARARTTALEAAEVGDRAAVLKAGDGELKALGALVSMRGSDVAEIEIELDSDARNVYMAVLNVVKNDSTTASRLAAELEKAGHVTLASEILSHVSGITAGEIEQ